MCIDECESFCFWSVIEKMDIYELTGTVLLLSLFVISVAVIVDRCSTYARAIKQSRAYESRALTALYYNHPDEAITAASYFPNSPIAAVVRATLDVSSPEIPKPSWPSFHPGGNCSDTRYHSLALGARSHWLVFTAARSSRGSGVYTALSA